MLQYIVRTTRSFLHDEEGAFLTIFGIMAIVLVALSGAVVDYVSVEQARNRAQLALDAAALSLQPSIYTDSNAQLSEKARALMLQQIDNDSIGVVMEDVSTDEDDGTLFLQARLTVPMTFVALVGFNEMTPVIVSEATRKKLFLEVTMVLDNSGSMGSQSRMSNLKAAARSATDILYDYQDPADGGDGSVSESTLISIVPFNFRVNIGNNYKNASWIDPTGAAFIGGDNFDDDDNEDTDFNEAVDRFALFDELNNVEWMGCVEARPGDLDTTDDLPDPSVPATMFVPQFSPDEPDSGNYYNDYIDDDPDACVSASALTRNCVEHREANWSGYWDIDYSYTATYPDSTVASGSNACSCDGEAILSDTGWVGGGSYYTRDRTCVDEYGPTPGSLSDRELQERLCKYNNTNADIDNNGNVNGIWNGPNEGCVDTPILPLTNTRDDVISTINAMDSGGATNIHIGTVWGFRTLSPTEPFTEGRDYDSAAYKVAIIMTDGENYYNVNYGNDSTQLNGSDSSPVYGFPYHERLGEMGDAAWELNDLIDAKLIQTCENMKATNIDIFTIGLNPSNSDLEDMLTDCASDPSQAYFPEHSSELGSVFETIALQLSDLRLAK